MNTYIHDALGARAARAARGRDTSSASLIEGGEATGVEYADADGERHDGRARALSSSRPARSTRRSSCSAPASTNAAIGRHLGLHPVRLVYGLFDEPQDAHMVYPITAHCMDHQHDEDGGFVIEATTIQDPISFATTLCDEQRPDVGPAARRGGARVPPLGRRARDGRTTTTTASVVVDEDGGERFDVDFQPAELERIDAALEFSRRVLEAAGATQVCWTGLASTHVQGSCRMGDDPARSVGRPQRRVARGEAALRRRRLARSRARSPSTRR